MNERRVLIPNYRFFLITQILQILQILFSHAY